MSAAWDAHYKRISDLIAANPVQRAPQSVAAVGPTVQPGVEAMLPQGLLDMWQGGANGGMEAPGKAGDLSGLMNGMGGWGPMAGGLAGGLLGTALAGPFGGALGAWGGRSLAGLLAGPTQTGTAQPTAPGTMGGNDGAFGGGAGAGTFGGGLGDAGTAGMGMGVGGLGAMSGNEIMGFQQGGYTGAGRDGVVQPNRRAGVVHEGELVIPHPVVRGLLAR